MTQREEPAVLTTLRPRRSDAAALLARLPKWPPGWYFVCRASELRSTRPHGVELAGRRLALFREQNGAPVAMDALCAHMGADLSYGQCEHGTLRCPLHGWVYDADGHCVSGYSGGHEHELARQRTYPALERLGCIFVHLDAAALRSDNEAPAFPLPFFAAAGLDDYVFGTPVALPIDGPWYWVGANGFDLRHFEVVHGRVCTRPPEVSDAGTHTRAIEYRFLIEGRSFSDRVVRLFLGARSELALTIAGGVVMSTEARFGRGVTSRAMYFITPTGDTTCRVHIVPFQRRLRALGPLAWPLERLALGVKRFLLRSFFAEEVKTLRNMGRAPVHFTAEDDQIRELFEWLASRMEASGRSAEDANAAG